MANQGKRIEPMDRGDFGKWTDAAQRRALDVRLNQLCTELHQSTGAWRKAIHDLDELTQGAPYIKAVKAAAETCGAMAVVSRTGVELIIKAAGKWASLLENPHHPRWGEAVNALNQLYDARQAIQHCDGMLQRVEAAIATALEKGDWQSPK